MKGFAVPARTVLRFCTPLGTVKDLPNFAYAEMPPLLSPFLIEMPLPLPNVGPYCEPLYIACAGYFIMLLNGSRPS